MNSEVVNTLTEDQIVVERTTKFPVSSEITDPDDDGSGETNNQTNDNRAF